MAKQSISYDKVALGVALVIALGLGFMLYSNAGKVKEDFPPVTGNRAGVPEMNNEQAFEAKTDEVGKPFPYPAPIDEKKRAVGTFTGIPLFLKKEVEEAVDLGDKAYPPVHPPIPNSWWLENRIDPGYADSPDRDPDKDGFSNREEFDAKTDPNGFKSHPPLINKLEIAGLVKKPFLLLYSGDTVAGAIKPSDTYTFKYEDAHTGRKRTNRTGYIKAGEGGASTIFSAAPGQLWLELKKVEKLKELNPRNNIMEENSYAHFEDVRPNKKGTMYKVKKGSRSGLIIRDFTATLYLNAIGQAGNEFKVEENGSFSLPFDEAAAEKPYKFTGLDAGGNVIIEYTLDGKPDQKILTPAQKP